MTTTPGPILNKTHTNRAHTLLFTDSTSPGFSHDHTTAGGGDEDKKQDIANVVRARTVLFPDEVKILHNKTHKAGDVQPGELCQLL